MSSMTSTISLTQVRSIKFDKVTFAEPLLENCNPWSIILFQSVASKHTPSFHAAFTDEDRSDPSLLLLGSPYVEVTQEGYERCALTSEEPCDP